MNENDVIQMTDGYKLDHRRQYPTGTEFVYSNFTARSSRIHGVDKVPFVGLAPFTNYFMFEQMEKTFFSRPLQAVTSDYQAFLDKYLGPNDVGTEHIKALWEYQKVPLEFCALPEGTLVPLRVPMFTVENTHRDFFWMTNYFETLMSAEIWMPSTSAATALRYRRMLDFYCTMTGGDPSFIDWQGHDFSFRGMGGVHSATISGLGHLMAFKGTDTIPAINLINRNYIVDEVVGMSVPATEHSVMCAGGQFEEMETLKRLMRLYPTGIVSVVSDTWDLWRLIGVYLSELKSIIMARKGKLVIRPDSGDPVLILTGDSSKKDRLANMGVVEALWHIFGGRVNEKGFKELDPHIGVIYGDAINEERANRICQRLMDKGFCTTNVVLGIGSFTYQYATRDVHGFALKATWAQVNGRERTLFKDPVTDDGTKRSARGRLVVCQNEGGHLELIDGLGKEEQKMYDQINLLKPVWREGIRTGSAPILREVRKRVLG
jgi:nicotinamide phosphoribosyltransferase